MEIARGVLSTTPPGPPPQQPSRAHQRTPLSPSSVPMAHDQPNRPIASVSIRQLPASECSRNFIKEDKLDQISMNRLKIDYEVPPYEVNRCDEFRESLKHLEHQCLGQPVFWYISQPEESPSSHKDYHVKDPITDSEFRQASGSENNGSAVSPFDALMLARKAMLRLQETTNLAGRCSPQEMDVDETLPSLQESNKGEKKMVRSGRLLERQMKKRRASRRNFSHDFSSSTNTRFSKKISRSLDPNDPFGLFLRNPESNKFLTRKEERDLFNQVQELQRIEKVKHCLRLQIGRDPTMSELAEAAGISCRSLQSSLTNGNRSRNKMIYANLRLVVHIAKNYEGTGLHLNDLLQFGSMGLMKSLEKFKPDAGCRFSTYSYWWIRQSIKKAIFQYSRAIRLPENMYADLKKIKTERMSCIQEGHLPTNKELAERVGIKVEKLERLLWLFRNPESFQQRIGTNQEVCLQEVTEDPQIERPDVYTMKLMMRQDVWKLLEILPARERHIIQLRYGMLGGEKMSLSAIGDAYGISKERIRQLQNRAMDKLKGCAESRGLGAYRSLLI